MSAVMNLLRSDKVATDPHHFCQTEQAVKAGIKVNEHQLHDANHGGFTDLHQLCQQCRTESAYETLLNYLKTHKEEAKMMDDNGQLPIDYLLRNDPPLGVVQVLLDAFPEAVYSDEGEHGEFPVHVAVRGGAAPEIVELLIEKNPDQLKYRTKSALRRKGFTVMELAERLPDDSANKDAIVEVLRKYFK